MGEGEGEKGEGMKGEGKNNMHGQLWDRFDMGSCINGCMVMKKVNMICNMDMDGMMDGSGMKDDGMKGSGMGDMSGMGSGDNDMGNDYVANWQPVDPSNWPGVAAANIEEQVIGQTCGVAPNNNLDRVVGGKNWPIKNSPWSVQF